MTKSGKKLHLLHQKPLKEKLSGYGIDSFTLSYLINSSRGEKLIKNVYNNMRQVKILEQKNWKGFSRHAKLTEKFDFLKKSL